MREIKFRFRIKKDKGKQVGYIFFTLEELLKPNILQDSDYVILSRDEYTGLLDKQGIEIYEGDIVEWLESFGHIAVQQEVKFEDGCFIIENSWSDLNKASAINEKVTVIGNIYEGVSNEH